MAATTESETEAGTDPAIAWLEQKAKGYSKDADELRARADRAAKALTALATAGLTAVGIAEIGAVYPWPAHSVIWLWVGILFVGFALMAGASFMFTIRFWRANRSLPMSASLLTLAQEDVTAEERRAIGRIYDDAFAHAPFTEHVPRDGGAAPAAASPQPERENVPRVAKFLRRLADKFDPPKTEPTPANPELLAKYELKADEWERDALYTPDSPISKRHLGYVARMRAEIEKAEERAKVVVVRQRMHQALAGWTTVGLAAMFIIGLVAFAVAADRLESDRARQACEVDKQGKRTQEASKMPPCNFYVKE